MEYMTAFEAADTWGVPKRSIVTINLHKVLLLWDDKNIKIDWSQWWEL